MKKLIFILLLIASVFGWGRTSFCEGYIQGYKDGVCYQSQYCLEPLDPLCPLPKLGEKTWKHGYNRGFLKGLSER